MLKEACESETMSEASLCISSSNEPPIRVPECNATHAQVLGEVLVALAIIALITLVFTKVVDHPPLAEVVEEVTTKKRGRR